MTAPAKWLARRVMRLEVFVYAFRSLDCGHKVQHGGEYFWHEAFDQTACPKCAQSAGWTL